MFKIQNVSKYYNTANNVSLGLRNVNCEFEKGEIVAIVGESGSGKTTFLNVISGMDTYEEGEILFNGEETSYFNDEDLEEFRKNNIGFIFQNYNLVDSYTVLQNVMFPLIVRGYTSIEAREKALELLEKVGLSNRANHKSTKLSGGEKQRVVIARALASDSQVLACDEPTGNLDSKTGKEIIDLIKSVAKDRLVLIVTHNYSEVENIATRRIRFHDGEIAEDIKIKQKEESQELTIKTKNHKLSFMDDVRLSIQNLLSTPRKTVITTVIFFVIAILVAVIYQNCYELSEETGYGYGSSYANTDPNRLVIFNKDKTVLDLEKIKNIIKNDFLVKNSFYEDNYITGNIDNDRKTFLPLTNVNLDKVNVTGDIIKNDDEIMIAVPKEEINDYKKYIGEEIIFEYSEFYKNVFTKKIVGVFEAYKGQQNTFLYGSEKTNLELKNQILFNPNKVSMAFEDNIYGNKIVNNATNDDNKIYITTSDQYSISKGITDNQYFLMFNNAYKIPLKVNDIVINSKMFGITTFETNYNYLATKLEQDIYQVSVYTDNQKHIKSELEKLGYLVHQPSAIDADIVNMFEVKITFYLLLFVSTIAICVIYLFSYIVLSKVYTSKNKDYTIIRTLGINKKNMSRIVNAEIIIIGFISSITAFSFLFIGNKVSDSLFFSLFNFVPLSRYLFFTLVMLLFSMFIGNKFNRKLFKYSINTNLKKEVLSND